MSAAVGSVPVLQRSDHSVDGRAAAAEQRRTIVPGARYVCDDCAIAVSLSQTPRVCCGLGAASNVSSAYTQRLLNESTGTYNDGTVNGTQCMQSMPLHFGMLPPALSNVTISTIVKRLHETATENTGHFVGGMFRCVDPGGLIRHLACFVRWRRGGDDSVLLLCLQFEVVASVALVDGCSRRRGAGDGPDIVPILRVWRVSRCSCPARLEQQLLYRDWCWVLSSPGSC
jgi:hypothetical protein